VDSEDKPIIVTTPDYSVRHKYQKDFWKMAGLMDGPAKEGGLGITAGAGGTVNVQVNIPALNDT